MLGFTEKGNFYWIFERFSRISFTAIVISQVILVLILIRPLRDTILQRKDNLHE